MASESQEGGPQALVDGQTGLPNRLHFDAVYQIVFAAGTRGFPISILLMDIPLTESSDMSALGPRLSGVTRDMDLLARMEGSRFTALLLGCNVHGARIAADRIVEAMEPWLEAHGTTMNVGVAAYGPGMEGPGDLMAAAEQALRHAMDRPGPAVET